MCNVLLASRPHYDIMMFKAGAKAVKLRWSLDSGGGDKMKKMLNVMKSDELNLELVNGVEEDRGNIALK